MVLDVIRAKEAPKEYSHDDTQLLDSPQTELQCKSDDEGQGQVDVLLAMTDKKSETAELEGASD